MTARKGAWLALAVCVLIPLQGKSAAAPEPLFQAGLEAYRNGDYAAALTAFRTAASQRPAAGTLQNLGNAEWQCGRVGMAVLAWEQAQWLDPLNSSIRNNLRFARKTAQLEAPELSWYEAVSTWLPVNWWAWIASLSFWLAVGMGAVPGLLRLRKVAWQQAIAALGLAVFLLSVPAHFGIQTRSRLGFVLLRETPLRLTPTAQAQFITRLPAGEPVRVERTRGKYLMVRTGRTVGWLEKDDFGLICSDPGSTGGAPKPATAASLAPAAADAQPTPKKSPIIP